MSNQLCVIAIDLEQLRLVCGSGDRQLLQSVIADDRENLQGMDQGDEFYEEFQPDYEAEYDAFCAGDFSSVDLKRTYEVMDDEIEGDSAPENDPELANLKSLLEQEASDDQLQQELEVLLSGVEFTLVDRDDLEPVKEISTGEALAHLLLGGRPDPNNSFKYGYALLSLCEQLGQVLGCDIWDAVRWEGLDVIDRFLRQQGFDEERFSTGAFLSGRAPVAIPEIDDFPLIGFLTRDEIGELLKQVDSSELIAELKASGRSDQPWLREASSWLNIAVTDIVSWLRTASAHNKDLICFYF